VGVEANFVVLRVVLKHRAARRSFLRIRSRAFTEIPRCIAIRMLHDKRQLLNVTVMAALFGCLVLRSLPSEVTIWLSCA